jgi:hypothetical protein
MVTLPTVIAGERLDLSDTRELSLELADTSPRRPQLSALAARNARPLTMIDLILVDSLV